MQQTYLLPESYFSASDSFLSHETRLCTVETKQLLARLDALSFIRSQSTFGLTGRSCCFNGAPTSNHD